MSASRTRGYAYARASARGVLLGLLLSVCLIAPIAISAADPTEGQPTDPPASQPTIQPTTSPSPQPTPSPSQVPTDAPAAPTTGPASAPASAPATAPSPAPSAPSSPAPSPAPSTAPSPASSVTYLVTFATTDAFLGRAALFATIGATETAAIVPLRIAAVDVPLARATAAALELRGASGVDRVETEAERTIEATPDDALFAEQWALPRIGWTQVYSGAAPLGSAVVAILDTGIDGSHPDLEGLLVPGATFAGAIPSNTDANGHGTQMAGIVAAHVNNATGVAGVAYAGVQLMPVTVLGADGTGTDADIIAGLVWAVDHGADVILMSFSSPSYSPSLQAALDYAWDHDVVLVAATGNDGSSAVTYPAGDRSVIGVSNTDENDDLNTSSNFGDDTFMAAPGTSILTTTTGHGYLQISGTSAAAAMVAGAAGLVRAFEPGASNGQVVYRLAISAEDVAPVERVGNGRLNLAGATASGATDFVQPAGAGVFGEGGPIVEPYVAAACVWTGASSTAWEDAGNWSGCAGAGGLPGATDSASIPATANAPTISVSTGTAIVKDLTVAAGVTLTMTGGTLEIWHDWKVNAAGVFNGTGGTVQFRASGGGGVTFAGSNQFYDIVVDSGVDPGFDNTTGSVINISHDFTNNNTSLPAGGAATFVFNGTGAQSIYSAKTGTAATFGNLTINKPSGTVTYTSNANITQLLSLTSGTLDLGTYTANRASNGNGLYMASGTLLRIGAASAPTGFTTVSLDASSTVEYYGAGQTLADWSYGNLTLSGSGTKTPATGLTVNGAFTIDSGPTFAAGSYTHTFYGAFTNTGGAGFSAGTSTAVFAGGAAQTLGANGTTFNNLTVNKSGATLTLAGNISLTGNLSVSAGTFDLATYTANRASAGGTLTVSAGVTLKVGGTNTLPANYSTISLDAASTTEYSGTDQPIAGVTYGHLSLSGSGSKEPSAPLTIAGNLTVAVGTVLDVSNGNHAISLAGNWSGSGGFAHGTGTVTFNGSGAQSIAGVADFYSITVNKSAGALTLAGSMNVDGNLTVTSGTLDGGSAEVNLNGSFSNSGTFTASTSTIVFGGSGAQTITGTTTFANVTINKASGTLTLASSVTISGTLSFSAGVLTTGGNVVLVTGLVDGAGAATGHVNGNLQRAVATSPLEFAIGGASVGQYTPVTVAGLSGSGSLTATTTASAPASIGSSAIDATQKANRTWTLTSSGTVSGSYAVEVTYLASDLDVGASQATFVVNRLSGGTWNTGSSSSTTGYVTTTAGFSAGTFGDFGVGTEKPATKLAFYQQPSNAFVATAITPAIIVEAQTSTSLRATFNTASIAMAIGTNPGGGSLTGTTPIAATNGLATFSDLSINAAGNGYTLTASASGLTGATSSTFNVVSSPGACTSTGSTAWNLTSTWTCARVPGSTDAVTIAAGHAVTIPASFSASAYSLTINAGGSSQSLAFSASTSTLTVVGNVTVNQPTNGNNSQLIVDAGALTVGGSLTLNTTATNNNRCMRLRITTGSVAISGNLVVNNPGTSSSCGTNGGFGNPTYMDHIDMSGGAGTLSVAGSVTIANPSNITAALTSNIGSVFNFNGSSSQTIPVPGSSNWVYSNIWVNNTSSGGASLGAAVTATKMTGNLTVYSGATLDNGGFAITGASGKTLTVQDSGTLRLGGTTAFPTGFSTFVLGGGSNSSTVSYYGGAQTIAATATLGTNYDNLTLSGTSVTKTAGGAITADARLTLSSSATFNMANFAISAGSLSGNGTLTFGSGSANTLTVGADGSTTTFSGTITGTSDTTDGLIKNGAGIFTLSGTNAYTGTLTINAGKLAIAADASLGAAPGSATAGKITFGGGTLQTTATFTLAANRGLAFSSTGKIEVASSTTLTYGGIAAGAGGLTKTGSGVLVLSGANTFSGATLISVGTVRQSTSANRLPTGTALTVSSGATFDLNSLSASIGSLAGDGSVTLGSGTLTTGGAGTSTTYGGTLSGTGGLTKVGAGSLSLSSANVTVGALTISAGSITAPATGQTFNVSGAWTNNASTSAFAAGSGTVTLNGSSTQTIGGTYATTFKGVTISNSAGISLSVSMTVNGTLQLSGGNVTTGANTLYIALGGSVSRVSGHVVGNLKKYVGAGAPNLTFEVGSASAYTPVAVGFSSVSVAGDLTATTTSGDHPSLTTSFVNSAKSANRYWTLTNSGVTFTSAAIAVTFVAGDVDAGADTNAFYVASYNGATWDSPHTTARSATSTTAIGITVFGDFVTGESAVPVPGSLAANPISTRRIDLSWLDNSSSETGYDVQKGTDGLAFAAYTTTAANATGTPVTGLTASTTYYLRVRTVTASGHSAWEYVSAATLNTPVGVADAYSTYEGVILVISAPGLLDNDPDGTNGFFTTSKVTDPSYGSVVVGNDGSFTYTPTGAYTGTDSFTYRVNDGALQGSPVTVTITVNTTAYVSSANWPTSASSSRYIEIAFPPYLPSGATVFGATLHHTYRSYDSAYSVCYYVEVYESTTLIATHGSAGSPISCSTGTSYQADSISLPEINTASRANNLSIRLIVWSSGGGKSEHRLADVSVDYQLD